MNIIIRSLILLAVTSTHLVSLARINSTGQDEVTAANHFLFSYLDQWISRINHTMNRIDQEQEGSASSDSISNRCFDHMRILLESGQNRDPWALKIFDSFGKPGSGIMEASLSFLGFYSECTGTSAPIQLDDSSDSDQGSSQESQFLFSGRYCLATLRLPNAALKSLKDKLPGTEGLHSNIYSAAQPKVGICLPSTCTQNEIHLIASQVLSSFISDATLTLAECSGENGDLKSDIGALVVLAVFAILMVPIVIGTVIDYIKNHCKQEEKQDWMRGRATTVTSVMSLTSINSEQPRPLGRRRRRNETCLRITDFLIAFSLIANIKKIFSSGGKSNLRHHKNTTSNTDSLHGIRVLMMMWIIAGHSYAFAMQWLFFRNPKEMKSAPKNLISQIFANGTFSTDSFLFISGLLVTNLCMKHMRKMNGKMNLIGFYVHRYLRMTPLMMAVIAFAANLLKYVSEGPSFQGSTVMFDSWCKKNWWINALYLHNFVNSENMCLAHTWYSAVDMQLYFITPLILIPLYHRPRIGFGIMSLLLTASMAFTAFITIRRHLPAVPYMNDMIAPDVVKDYYASVYIKPYTRIGPYLIGMALGFVLHTLEGKIRLSKTQAIAGWIFAVTANLGVLFAMLPVNAIPGYELPDVLAGIYSSTSRVVWALSLAWITFACSAGKGGLLGSMLSSRVWLPWSRLTYGAYLIHPIVMAIFYGSRHSTFEFSHFLMSYIALGNLVLTYVASLVLCVLFESPIIALEKLLTEGRSRSGSNTHVLPG